MISPAESVPSPSAPPFVEDESRETTAQFRELMAHLGQVFWMKNVADTAVLYVSPAYERIWGYSCRSLYDGSHTFLDSVHPEDRARVGAAMTRKRSTEGYEEEYRILRSDGALRWIWARSYPVRNQLGEIHRYAGIAEDISERKWAEKERARLAAIIEHAEDAIVSTTLEGTIIAWNHGAERKYGYLAEEIIGRSLYVLIPPDHSQAYQDVIKRIRQGEPVPAYDTVRRRKDGTLIAFSIGISPIEARDGEIIGVSKIAQDLSRVRKLESQLIEAQKMAVIGQLTGGVAHDFNNILTIVMGYSEWLLQELGTTDPLHRFAEAIRHAAQRGAGLTRQLLVFSRKETVQPVVLDLNVVLGDMDMLLRQLLHEDFELTVTCGTQLGRITADLGYIAQVLMNLVGNARDAMPGGGKVTIATSNVSLDENYATAHPGVACGDYVLLSVGDTGTGMSDEIKAHLFEPFFTTKPKGTGTGLGLTTCRTIIQHCGGSVDVVSAVGHGTTFKIYFPRVTDLATSFHPSSPGPLPRGTETVLVVEDDPDVRRLARVVLEAQGYEVLTAVNGEDGLRLVTNHTGPIIRLVISDVVMPRMDGATMAAALVAKNPHLKILFTSGYTDDAIAHRGVLEAGIAFLPKPYTVAALARKVRELLDQPPA